MNVVTYKAAGTGAVANANTQGVTLPTGWAAGDFALLTGFAFTAADTWTVPPGWTAITPLITSDADYGSLFAAYRFLKIGDSGPTLAYSAAADSFAARIITFSRVNRLNPLDIAATTETFAVPGDPYAVELTAVTTVSGGALIYYLYGIKAQAGSTCDWTERQDNGTGLGSDCQLGGSEKSMLTAGASGVCTVTYAAAGTLANGTAGKIVLRSGGGLFLPIRQTKNLINNYKERVIINL